MPPPLLALELIGARTDAFTEPCHEGSWNRVWRVRTIRNERFIIKNYRSSVSYQTERDSIIHLRNCGFAVPEIAAIAGRTIVFHDSGARPVSSIDELIGRSIGYNLSKLHSIPSQRIPVRDAPGSGLLAHALRRVQLPEDIQALRGFVHGDANPSNVLINIQGDFKCFIDWEEAGIGNPILDLMLTCVEFGINFSKQMNQVVQWILLGYFSNRRNDDLWSYWSDLTLRTDLYHAVLGSLHDWAIETGEETFSVASDKHAHDLRHCIDVETSALNSGVMEQSVHHA